MPQRHFTSSTIPARQTTTAEVVCRQPTATQGYTGKITRTPPALTVVVRLRLFEGDTVRTNFIRVTPAEGPLKITKKNLCVLVLLE
jgi:hypothetical protein